MTDDDRLVATVVRDAAGADLGTVTALRVDPDGLHARWLDLVLPGGGRATVPVQAASVDAAGRMVLPFSGEDLRTAPPVDDAEVSADLARALLRHYGFPPDTR